MFSCIVWGFRLVDRFMSYLNGHYKCTILANPAVSHPKHECNSYWQEITKFYRTMINWWPNWFQIREAHRNNKCNMWFCRCGCNCFHFRIVCLCVVRKSCCFFTRNSDVPMVFHGFAPKYWFSLRCLMCLLQCMCFPLGLYGFRSKYMFLFRWWNLTTRDKSSETRVARWRCHKPIQHQRCGDSRLSGAAPARWHKDWRH